MTNPNTPTPSNSVVTEASPTNLTEARALIREIDRKIDAGRRNRTDGHYERECELFRHRGELQLIRDNLEYRAATRQFRAPKAKKCPSCGGRTFA